MTGKSISDDDLHAYVDDELDAEPMADVEAFLRSRPDKQFLVTQWRLQNQTIGALLNPVVEEPLPQRLQPSRLAAMSQGGSRVWMSVTAALLLIVVSAAAGWYGRGALGPGGSGDAYLASANSLVQRALNAHAVYSVEVLHPVEVTAQRQDHLVKWLSKRLGSAIVAPDLEAQGFSLVGGRLLPAADGPAAQFMYEDRIGRRVTVFAARNSGNGLASFRFAEKDGIQAFYWLTSDLSFALSGRVTRKELRRLSQLVYDQAI